MKIAIVGSGVSGLSAGRLLTEAGHTTTIYEAAATYGGLVKCERIDGNLFHRVGGHVFNSRNQAVLDWFWGQFDRDNEFLKAKRFAKIYMGGKYVGYPIENYLFQLPPDLVSRILDDVLQLSSKAAQDPFSYPHFEAFLLGNFGPMLYETYFKPYNYKIWNTDLTQVPMHWLEGKLPMPNFKEMLMLNIVRQEEEGMVHASFYYAKRGGSQFIVDRLAEGQDIRLSSPVTRLEAKPQGWLVNGEAYDAVVFTGDVRRLGQLWTDGDADTQQALQAVTNLRTNGTSNVLCECDANDMSWLYLPESHIKAHRIIYTGNFAESNNEGVSTPGRKTCVVEFSGKQDQDLMVQQLAMLPGNLKPLAFNYEPNSYVVQDIDTRTNIAQLRSITEGQQLYLLGRFGEWEYHNMDKAIEAAMAVRDRLV